MWVAHSIEAYVSLPARPMTPHCSSSLLRALGGTWLWLSSWLCVDSGSSGRSWRGSSAAALAACTCSPCPLRRCRHGLPWVLQSTFWLPHCNLGLRVPSAPATAHSSLVLVLQRGIWPRRRGPCPLATVSCCAPVLISKIHNTAQDVCGATTYSN